MSIATMSSATELDDPASTTAETDPFDLDIRSLEVADAASLVNLTNDNCGSTCGACVTGAA